MNNFIKHPERMLLIEFKDWTFKRRRKNAEGSYAICWIAKKIIYYNPELEKNEWDFRVVISHEIAHVLLDRMSIQFIDTEKMATILGLSLLGLKYNRKTLKFIKEHISPNIWDKSFVKQKQPFGNEMLEYLNKRSDFNAEEIK